MVRSLHILGGKPTTRIVIVLALAIAGTLAAISFRAGPAQSAQPPAVVTVQPLSEQPDVRRQACRVIVLSDGVESDTLAIGDFVEIPAGMQLAITYWNAQATTPPGERPALAFAFEGLPLAFQQTEANGVELYTGSEPVLIYTGPDVAMRFSRGPVTTGASTVVICIAGHLVQAS